MLFHTPTQYAVLALLLIAGWFLGLASHPGGRKWRRRYEAERDAHAAARQDFEARQAAADKRIAELESRNATLESDLRKANAAVPAAPLPGDAPARGRWLGAGDVDDLSRIRGIDGSLQKRLADAGVASYADIEAIPAADETALENRIAIPEGTIAREQWREQAMLLREGRDTEWRDRFG